MRDINRLRNVLSPEQLQIMEEVFLQLDTTLQSFKLMRKNYTQLKSRVRQIEKKLVAIYNPDRSDISTAARVSREVGHIENKYKDMDKAIRQYKQEMRFFNQTLHSPGLRSFDPRQQHNPVINRLKGCLNSADMRINRAVDAMRITGRYFQNIDSSFKNYANLIAIKNRKKT